MAETEDLKSFQYRFESDRGHIELFFHFLTLRRFSSTLDKSVKMRTLGV